jgi:urease accessory protein
MSDATSNLTAQALLKLQSWLSPAFPSGAYSYSHGLEWAVEVGQVDSRRSLVDWLEADLCYGTGRNEAIFFSEAFHCAMDGNDARLGDVVELAAASRGSSEFALESSQQAAAYLSTLRQAWPDRILDSLAEILRRCRVQPAVAVVLGARAAGEGIPVSLALPGFLHSYVANLVIAGVRLVPLGQTDGQLAVAELESAILFASEQARDATIDDIGSAAVMVDFASISHETQYTRLFRS